MKNLAVRAIIKERDSYLLVQRNRNSSKPGFWQFPGGKTDNQNPIKALKREIKEEIGLKIKNIKKLKEFWESKKKFCTRFYKVDKEGTIKLQKSELDGYGWFTRNMAKKFNNVLKKQANESQATFVDLHSGGSVFTKNYPEIRKSPFKKE